MVKCPFCQFENEDGALFCEQCKSDLASVAPTPAAALPAALAGSTDWSELHEQQMRVGVVHALANTAAVVLYAASLAAPDRAARGRELRVCGVLVKRFRVPAESQELVFASFEEQGWPEWIDDPLPGEAGRDRHKHLHETITNLNRKQRHPLIRFKGDGTGTRIGGSPQPVRTLGAPATRTRARARAPSSSQLLAQRRRLRPSLVESAPGQKGRDNQAAEMDERIPQLNTAAQQSMRSGKGGLATQALTQAGVLTQQRQQLNPQIQSIAAQVAKDIPGLPADHILVAADHTHAGPDTIGAWGGVPTAYLQRIHDQTVAAIEAAYRARKPATVVAGHSDASDLIYNQACTEAPRMRP